MSVEVKGYGENSIVALEGADTVRKRPSVIFGTNDITGCTSGIFEIIANSVDEAREGHGDTINVSVFNDGSVEVEDFGRGVPMGYNENAKKFNWELVFCQLYAGGKMEEDSYSMSLGLNGLGATAMQFASEWFTVESKREDGNKYYMEFEKGVPKTELKVTKNTDGKTGTKISFKPDITVFTDIYVEIETYIDRLRRIAMIHDGLKIRLYDEGSDNTMTLVFKDGTKDFIDMTCGKPMMKHTATYRESATGYDVETNPVPYTVNMRISFNFSTEVCAEELYHNGSSLFEAGATQLALRNGVLKSLEDYMKENGKLNKNEKLNYRDIESLLFIVGDTSCPGSRVFWKNQTKGAITNPFIRKSFEAFVYNSVAEWITDDGYSSNVITAILDNKKAREEADKVSKRLLQKLSKNPTIMGNKPDKFVDCSTTDVSKREIYIVEGDSALGACKLSRDSDFQAIIPVRGKILNCLKAELVKIFGNDIIIDLIAVLGCGVEAKSKYIKDLPEFNIAKCRWGKVIICTDADVDGMQIRCLILAMIYRLMPTLIKEGRVFIAETPLFEITAKGNTAFAYDEEEKQKIMDYLINKKQLSAKQINVQRSKGLGENEPEMMSVSTMAPATRRLVPVEYSADEESLAKIFQALLGDNLEGRKAMIDEYFVMTADVE